MQINGCNALCASLIMVLILSLDDNARGQAAIEGKVSLPAPEKIAASPPRYPGQVGEIALPDPPVAVVYLTGDFPADATNLPPSVSQVLQKGMQFRPALLPVRLGTTVSFPNGDEFYHNVFSYSKPKRFDLGRYRKEDKPATQVFDKVGVVKLYCEIHQHMRGVILVLDTPYFTRTDTNGVYRLENLPPGHYLLNAWADEKRVAQQPVDLVVGRTLQVDFDLKQSPH
jgi:plastocyanin